MNIQLNRQRTPIETTTYYGPYYGKYVLVGEKFTIRDLDITTSMVNSFHLTLEFIVKTKKRLQIHIKTLKHNIHIQMTPKRKRKHMEDLFGETMPKMIKESEKVDNNYKMLSVSAVRFHAWCEKNKKEKLVELNADKSKLEAIFGMTIQEMIKEAKIVDEKYQSEIKVKKAPKPHQIIQVNGLTKSSSARDS